MADQLNAPQPEYMSDVRFTYDDRWLRNRSIKMFDIYCKYYGLTTAEEIARCWNGGPKGYKNPSTIRYWSKVKKYLKLKVGN